MSTISSGHLSTRDRDRERDRDRKRERARVDTGQPARATYGRYENVLLSQSELDGLKADLPDKWNYYIDRLSCHIASSGKRYKSHAATIYKWAQEDAAKKAPKKGIPDYSCKEGESFMKNEINAVLENMTTVYPGAGGLHRRGRFYCTAASAVSRKKPILRRIRPLSLAVTVTRQSATAREPPARNGRPPEKRRRHLDTVEELKRRGFTDPTMRDWTFENDNGRNPQAGIARRYVEHWEDMRADNIGCLFWGRAWEPGKVTLRAVSQTPSWRKKSPST